MPDRLPPLEYPDRFEVRYVSANGGMRWNRRWVNVSTVCIGEYVGLEEIDDGIEPPAEREPVTATVAHADIRGLGTTLLVSVAAPASL